MANETPLNLSEAEWWERYSDLATKQWELPFHLHEIVRRDYLIEMREHLYLDGGSLLDIGCGSGWAGIEAVRPDMSLVGIDTSPAQIEKARQRAQIDGFSKSRFENTELDHLDPQQTFDSVLIHAVLHHMSEEDIEILLTQVWQRLKPGGRLYIYEPLTSILPGLGIRLAAYIIFLIAWSPFWLLNKVAYRFQVGPREFRKSIQDGWTGLSPDERPIPREWLLKLLEPGFKVERVRYWQSYSLALAMGGKDLPALVEKLTEWTVRALYWLDQRVLNTFLKDSVLGAWTWASVSAQRI